MITDNATVGNLYSKESYNFRASGSVVLYARTSPDRGSVRHSPNATINAMRHWADTEGLQVIGAFVDRGCDGRRVGPKREGLKNAVEAATAMRCPVMAWHVQRLCREPHKLQDLGCDFVTFHPLDMPEIEINNLTCKLVCQDRRRAGQRMGRPGRRVLTEELREKVKHSAKLFSLRDVGKIYGLPKSTISDIVRS